LNETRVGLKVDSFYYSISIIIMLIFTISLGRNGLFSTNQKRFHQLHNSIQLNYSRQFLKKKLNFCLYYIAVNRLISLLVSLSSDRRNMLLPLKVFRKQTAYYNDFKYLWISAALHRFVSWDDKHLVYNLGLTNKLQVTVLRIQTTCWLTPFFRLENGHLVFLLHHLCSHISISWTHIISLHSTLIFSSSTTIVLNLDSTTSLNI